MINYSIDDYIVGASAKNGLIRGVAMRSTTLAKKAMRVHNLCPTSTRALGQLLTASALMAQDLKTNNASLTLSIHSDGPLHTLVSVANNDGCVRGFADPAAIDTRYTDAGRIDMQGALGQGTLTVSRYDGLDRRPYLSSIELVNGDIANDIASYLYFSAQIPSVIFLGVNLDKNGVRHAGGMLVQLMPGWDDDLAKWLEARAGSFPDITHWFDEGMNPHHLLDLLFGDPDINYADPIPASFTCNCSEKRMLTNVFSLPDDDLAELIDDPNGISLTCHFCNKHYHFSQNDLRGVRDQRQQSI